MYWKGNMIKHNLQTSNYLCVSMTNIVEFSRGVPSVQMTPTSNHSWNICNSPIVSTMTSHVWVLVVNEGNWKVAPSLGLYAHFLQGGYNDCDYIADSVVQVGRRYSYWSISFYFNLPSWELTYGSPKSSILIGFSIINHPFWGPTPIFGNSHIPFEETLFESMIFSCSKVVGWYVSPLGGML